MSKITRGIEVFARRLLKIAPSGAVVAVTLVAQEGIYDLYTGCGESGEIEVEIVPGDPDNSITIREDGSRELELSHQEVQRINWLGGTTKWSALLLEERGLVTGTNIIGPEVVEGLRGLEEFTYLPEGQPLEVKIKELVRAE